MKRQKISSSSSMSPAVLLSSSCPPSLPSSASSTSLSSVRREEPRQAAAGVRVADDSVAVAAATGNAGHQLSSPRLGQVQCDAQGDVGVASGQLSFLWPSSCVQQSNTAESHLGAGTDCARLREGASIDAPTVATVNADRPLSSPGQLPEYKPSPAANFRWGRLTGAEFSHVTRCAYSEIVHWRRNTFMVPSGKAGKLFVRELTALFNAYAQGSALEVVALTAAMVACALLLQKPHPTSKCRDHVTALERRLSAWKDGDIDGLMREGRTIQTHLQSRRHNASEEQNSRVFSKLMFEGKTRAALRYLSENSSSGLLDIDENVDERRTVLDVLRAKHPPAADVHQEALITTTNEPPEVHPVLFDCLTSQSIRNAALRTQGSAGPSGVDAAGWKRLCSAFHKDSGDLCAAIAAVGRRLSTEFVDPEALQALLACRLIPLNKHPGVRPIGVCEVVRRILGKAILGVVADDVRLAAGPLQLCCGQDVGCEAAVHAIRAVFEEDNTDGILMIDASNAFNNLNRRVALYNIQYTCPAIAKSLINCYRKSSCLFVGGKMLLSNEGTTQGDPLAMVMFGLATVPMIERLKSPNTVQCWFADDGAAGARLRHLWQWWEALATIGPQYGYYPNESKTYLVVKSNKEEEAREVFKRTEVQITCVGSNYLGGALGTKGFEEEFMAEKIVQWTKEIQQLADFARSQPHAAHAAFTHGLISRWTYAMRVGANVAERAMESMEKEIAQHLIPSLTGQPPPNETIRQLLALPARLGGLGLINPTTLKGATSKAICAPLVSLILKQEGDVLSARKIQKQIKHRVRQEQRSSLTAEADELFKRLPENTQRCMNAAQEKGVSSWLSALPLERHNFVLHKSDFRDALALRYSWPLQGSPQSCACGQLFSVDHALTCRCGGYIGRRHDMIRDLTADLLREVAVNVSTEPRLQPLSGERLGSSANMSDSARLDIKATGFWNDAKDAFFDVRVVHPFASSYNGQRLTSIYRQHEQKKRAEYGRRVREIEYGSFTPLVFTTTGGMAGEATVFYRRLAALLSSKRDEPYSTVMGWLRCSLSFSLLRAAITCVRGTKKRRDKEIYSDCLSEVVASSRLTIH